MDCFHGRIYFHTHSDVAMCVKGVSIGAVAEDCGAYADEGGAGGYGERVVVAHAHGEGVEAAEVGACLLYFGL